MAEVTSSEPSLDQVLAFLERARSFAGATEEARTMMRAAIEIIGQSVRLRELLDDTAIDMTNAALAAAVAIDEQIQNAPIALDSMLAIRRAWSESRHALFFALGMASSAARTDHDG